MFTVTEGEGCGKSGLTKQTPLSHYLWQFGAEFEFLVRPRVGDTLELLIFVVIWIGSAKNSRSRRSLSRLSVTANLVSVLWSSETRLLGTPSHPLVVRDIRVNSVVDDTFILAPKSLLWRTSELSNVLVFHCKFEQCMYDLRVEGQLVTKLTASRTTKWTLLRAFSSVCDRRHTHSPCRVQSVTAVAPK